MADGCSMFDTDLSDDEGICVDTADVGDSWIQYAERYHYAARALAEQALASQEEAAKLLVPAIHEYRHVLELALKSLIYAIRRRLDDAKPIPATHKYERLIRDLVALYPRIPALSGKLDLVLMNKQLDEISKYDPKGETFRYPVSPDGTPTLPSLIRVDHEHFFEQADRLAHQLLDAAIFVDDL